MPLVLSPWRIALAIEHQGSRNVDFYSKGTARELDEIRGRLRIIEELVGRLAAANLSEMDIRDSIGLDPTEDICEWKEE